MVNNFHLKLLTTLRPNTRINYTHCSGQLIPDIELRFSSALAGESPLL